MRHFYADNNRATSEQSNAFKYLESYGVADIRCLIQKMSYNCHALVDIRVSSFGMLLFSIQLQNTAKKPDCLNV